MAKKELILDRYEVLGTAGAGGFGTVRIAWDPRIQRKVAIKAIELTESDARRAGQQDSETDEPEPEPEPEGKPDESWVAPWEDDARDPRPVALSPAEKARLQDAEPAASDEPPVEADAGLSADAEDAIDPAAEDEAVAGNRGASPKRAVPIPDDIDPFQTRSLIDDARESLRAIPPLALDGEEGAFESAPTGVMQAVPAASGPLEPDAFEDPLDSQAGFAEDAMRQNPDGQPEEPEDASDSDRLPDDEPAEAPVLEPVANDAGRSAFIPLTKSMELPKGRWRGVTPWNEYLESEDEGEEPGDGPKTVLAHVPGLDEARTAAKLHDSRIVTVYDFEVRDQMAYLIMEYVEGITLTELLFSYGDMLTLDMVTSVFDAVAGALSVAHKAGVLHLDIKPDNIIINADGQAKVTDFGLATLADASGAGTTGGGTIGYMPLEQMRRQHLDARSDEWSLAAVAYEMLTGDSPFRARNLEQAERAILDAELVVPSLCWPAIDSQIDDVVFYALDPDMDERYASIDDFTEEMDKFLGDARQGQEQLALVVEDALTGGGMLDADDEDIEDAGEGAEDPASGRTGLLARVRQGLDDRRRRHVGRRQPRMDRSRAGRMAAARQAALDDLDEYVDFDDDYGDYGPGAYRDRGGKEPRAGHVPLIDRIPSEVFPIAGRVFNAAGCAFIGALAFSNIGFLDVIFGDQSPLSMISGAAIFAVVGALFPLYGALAAYLMLSLAIIICGHPIVGAVLALASGLWWYITGRDGMADGNVALFGAIGGGVGFAPAVPFASGLALRPLQALVTMGFACVVACVFASFGSSTLQGWDLFNHWWFSGADITKSFARIITRPLTWTTIAGWMAAAGVLSVFAMRRNRVALILGVVAAAALILTGTLIFGLPMPELFLTTFAGAGAALALFL